VELSVRKSGDMAVVAITGAIDLAKSPDLRQQIIGLVDEGVRGLVVDLSHVKYLDSSGMATLVDALNRLRARGGRMVVAGAAAEMREMFRITRLDQRFTFVADANLAVESMKKALRDGA
jgi:anti-sigma B factor antagonist